MEKTLSVKAFKPFAVLCFHPNLGCPERARVASAEKVRENTEVRVPSAGHADHRSAVAEAAMGYDQKYVFAPGRQFKSHFRSIWLAAPRVAKQARRVATCDATRNFAFIAFGGWRLFRRQLREPELQFHAAAYA